MLPGGHGQASGGISFLTSLRDRTKAVSSRVSPFVHDADDGKSLRLPIASPLFGAVQIEDAKQLAEKHGIEIVNEVGLANMVDDTGARFDPEAQAILTDTRKFCPKCRPKWCCGRRPGVSVLVVSFGVARRTQSADSRCRSRKQRQTTDQRDFAQCPPVMGKTSPARIRPTRIFRA